MQRQIGSYAHRDGQRPALLLGTLECETQMPPKVELDRNAIRPEHLQSMIGRIIDSRNGILHDNDTGGDVAACGAGGMKQRWKERFDVKPGFQNNLLHRRFGDDLGDDRTADRALDKAADAVKVETKGGLAILFRTQQIPDDRRVIAPYRRKKQSLLSIQLLQDSRDFQMRIDRFLIGEHAIALDHASERRTEARIQNLRHPALLPDAILINEF